MIKLTVMITTILMINIMTTIVLGRVPVMRGRNLRLCIKSLSLSTRVSIRFVIIIIINHHDDIIIIINIKIIIKIMIKMSQAQTLEVMLPNGKMVAATLVS